MTAADGNFQRHDHDLGPAVIARVPYEVVDTPDPRTGPKGKLPFIEDAGRRIADTSIIVDHLVKTRGLDPDARLNASQPRHRAPGAAYLGRALIDVPRKYVLKKSGKGFGGWALTISQGTNDEAQIF